MRKHVTQNNNTACDIDIIVYARLAERDLQTKGLNVRAIQIFHFRIIKHRIYFRFRYYAIMEYVIMYIFVPIFHDTY